MIDSSTRPVLWWEAGGEVIPYMGMEDLLTEGRSGGWEAPKPQMSTRDNLLELIMQKQAQQALLSHGLWGYPSSRAQFQVTRDLG